MQSDLLLDAQAPQDTIKVSTAQLHCISFLYTIKMKGKQDLASPYKSKHCIGPG